MLDSKCFALFFLTKGKGLIITVARKLQLRRSQFSLTLFYKLIVSLKRLFNKSRRILDGLEKDSILVL